MNRIQAIDVRLLGLRPGERVLDVGCGVGRHLLDLSHVPGLRVGVDWAREDLRRGAYWFHTMRLEGKTRGDVYFMQGDGSRLPFANRSFDRVICTEVLEHVADERAVVAELVRVLRPGGVLAASVPDEISERLMWQLSRKYPAAPGGHVRIYSRRAIRRLLSEGGLRPFAVRFRHSLEALFWLFGALVPSNDYDRHPLIEVVRAALSTEHPQFSDILNRCDGLGNYLLPKSIVLYARKAREARA